MKFESRAAFLAHFRKTEYDVQKDLNPKTKNFTGREYIYDDNMKRHYLEEEITHSQQQL